MDSTLNASPLDFLLGAAVTGLISLLMVLELHRRFYIVLIRRQ